MIELLSGELESLAEGFMVFDQDYSPQMKNHPYYQDIMKDQFDTYRDLERVWGSDLFKDDPKFRASNTLLIDSEDVKVQLWLENSIITDPYTFTDV